MQNISIENINVDELKSLIRDCIRAEINPLLKKNEEPIEKLLSIEHVAALFKVSKVTIHKWKRKGLLPFHKINRKLYFKRSELLKAIDQDNKKRYRL